MKMNDIDILSVGILVADIITKPVDEIPKKGLLRRVESIELFNGGNAMTSAINVSKLGLKSAVIGKIGNDSFGDSLVKILEKNHVNYEGLAIDEFVQTSTTVVLSSTDGERTFLHCVGANGTFAIDDINWDIVKKAKIVFVTGTFLLDTFDGEQTMQFLKECKNLGKITALDVCWDSGGKWGKLLDMCMPYIDIFMPSIEEAMEISGKTHIDEIADIFFAKGVKSVVIKLGKDGCYIRESVNAEAHTIPTYTHIKPVDTTGAGDSFCSGFLTALTKGKDFMECAKFANAVGTHCVMAKGATTGIKSYDDIIKFMNE